MSLQYGNCHYLYNGDPHNWNDCLHIETGRLVIFYRTNAGPWILRYPIHFCKSRMGPIMKHINKIVLFDVFQKYAQHSKYILGCWSRHCISIHLMLFHQYNVQREKYNFLPNPLGIVSSFCCKNLTHYSFRICYTDKRFHVYRMYKYVLKHNLA